MAYPHVSALPSFLRATQAYPPHIVEGRVVLARRDTGNTAMGRDGCSRKRVKEDTDPYFPQNKVSVPALDVTAMGTAMAEVRRILRTSTI